MKRSWLWNINKTEDEIKRILKDPQEKSFVHYASLLLSRHSGLPKEIFQDFLSKENFCRHWFEIKRKMRKDKWNDERIPFWDEVYKYLIREFKKKNVVFSRQGKQVQKKPAWEKMAGDIRAWRRAQKMTQAEFAKKMGVKQQFISKIESGTRNLSTRTLEKIRKAAGISLPGPAPEKRDISDRPVSETHEMWHPLDPGIRTTSQ
ncbi:MAG: helix-turn-helix transcriptional regulator [Candidatus Omnitrophota bacterium]